MIFAVFCLPNETLDLAISTFPPELVDILKPVINQMDLFGQADKGNHEIRVNPGNVHQALTNLGRLHKILEQKRNGNRLQE